MRRMELPNMALLEAAGRVGHVPTPKKPKLGRPPRKKKKPVVPVVNPHRPMTSTDYVHLLAAQKPGMTQYQAGASIGLTTMQVFTLRKLHRQRIEQHRRKA